MQENQPKAAGCPKSFDLLEKKLVFLVSRIFFWILCAAAGVGFVVAVLLFLYNAIPPVKQKVADVPMPTEVAVSLADVRQAIARPEPESAAKAKPAPTRPSTETKSAPVQPKPDSLQLALQAKIESLRSYFPADNYAWENQYATRVVRTDWWGNPVQTERYVSKYGVVGRLDRVLSLYDAKVKRMEVVEELLGIISKIAVEERGDALTAYAELRSNMEDSRRRQISDIQSEVAGKRVAAEARFAAEKAKKATGIMFALRFMVGTFAGIALIGLFLCFLAIERNTRALRALLEKGNQG